MARDYTDDDIRRDEYDPAYDRRYGRRNDNSGWGWLSLLLIPLLALGAWWLYSNYKGSNTAYNNTPANVRSQNPTPTKGIQTGVGGGPNTSVSPSPRVTVSPTPTSGVKQGVGGSGYTNNSSSTTTGQGGSGYTYPTSGPNTGEGGMGY